MSNFSHEEIVTLFVRRQGKCFSHKNLNFSPFLVKLHEMLSKYMCSWKSHMFFPLSYECCVDPHVKTK